MPQFSVTIPVRISKEVKAQIDQIETRQRSKFIREAIELALVKRNETQQNEIQAKRQRIKSLMKKSKNIFQDIQKPQEWQRKLRLEWE